VTCVAQGTNTCAQYQFANRTGTTFQAPAEAVDLRGSLWAVRFGVRLTF